MFSSAICASSSARAARSSARADRTAHSFETVARSVSTPSSVLFPTSTSLAWILRFLAGFFAAAMGWLPYAARVGRASPHGTGEIADEACQPPEPERNDDEDELLAVLRERAPALASVAMLGLPLADELSEGGVAEVKALLPWIVDVSDLPEIRSSTACDEW